jgi:DNA-binding NarL/FixJ family response regulator
VSEPRILIVDDFEDFRRFVTSTLQQKAEYQVIGQASDGLEALQKAEQLQPDLILLDIALPKLNGFETAKRLPLFIRHTKILFISEEASPDMAREAFRVGAHGYVHKLRAARDLLPAIEAVLAGKRFLSRGLNLGEGTEVHRRHEVQFYSSDSVLLDSFRDCVAVALKTGDAAIVLATKLHQQALVQELQKGGFNIDREIRRGTYIQLDAPYMLSTVVANGMLDRVRFLEGLVGLIASASIATHKENPRIAICGECVGLLLPEGNVTAALQLEKVGNELIQTQNVDIMCAYPSTGFQGEEGDRVFKNICAGHTAVYYR